MELALRTSFLSMLASVVTLVLLWRHGWWLLVALFPYAIAYLAYRGAVAVAHEYGTALAVMVDLNRFALYDRLRVKLPTDIDEERRPQPAADAAVPERAEHRGGPLRPHTAAGAGCHRAATTPPEDPT